MNDREGRILAICMVLLALACTALLIQGNTERREHNEIMKGFSWVMKQFTDAFNLHLSQPARIIERENVCMLPPVTSASSRQPVCDVYDGNRGCYELCGKYYNNTQQVESC